MTTRRFYVDSSAYLAVLLNEAGAAELRSELMRSELLSSVLLIAEARRTLVRLSREHVLDDEEFASCCKQIDEDLETFELRSVTLDLCPITVFPVASTPRTLDLVHLSTALWFHGQQALTRFVSRDLRQSRSAYELGLPVER
jgi:hypothetical protein